MNDRVWTRSQIEDLIAEGRKIVIFKGQVIKADAWLPFHPGGDKAILHMVGRDGTDEISALHSLEAQAHMQKFMIGRIEGRWNNFLPPIQGGHFRTLSEQAVVAEDDVVPSSGEESSAATSPAPSPLFDATEGLRRRRSISMSSTSSISLPEAMTQSKPKDIASLTAAQIAADMAQYPCLSSASQTQIMDKYRQLDTQIRAAGLYSCNYTAYAWEISRYCLLFGLMAASLHYQQYALAGLFLGLFWHQLVFTAHDAGHMGITHHYHVDTCIGIVVADFLGGLSLGWWKRSHNVHHIVTNSPEHDPDIEQMPFFAISHRFFEGLRSSYYDRVMDFDAVAQIAVKYQHYMYYPLLCLGRFNLYLLSWEYLLSSSLAPRKGPAWWHRYFEIVGQLFFWYWFGYQTVWLRIPTYTSRVIFILISHTVTAPLHVQITLSHFAMSTADLGVTESFAQRMLRTTMDVHCPAWLDFLHGGLQFQAVHHLFPRVPRHNLRACRKYVEEFCRDTQIPYTIYGFREGNKVVLSHLQEVAKQVEIFEECRRHAAEALLAGEDAF